MRGRGDFISSGPPWDLQWWGEYPYRYAGNTPTLFQSIHQGLLFYCSDSMGKHLVGQVLFPSTAS